MGVTSDLSRFACHLPASAFMVLSVLSEAYFIRAFITMMVHHCFTTMLAVNDHYRRVTDIISDNDGVV